MQTKTFDKLYHVGRWDPLLKNKRGLSYEGRGVSVSEFPEAWRKIARLGNAPVWVLTKPENKFLDWLGLTAQEKEAASIWAAEAGLLTRATIWEVSWFDDELDEKVALAMLTEQEADAEMDEGRVKSSYEGWAPTLALAIFSGYSLGALPLGYVQDSVAVAYATHLGLDGVFWDERLNVSAYSAPRAVIVLEQLESWRKVQA